MAFAMLNFTEFGSFPGALRKRGRRYTDTFCGRIFIAIFANVTENECIIHGRSHVTGCHHYNNLLTHCCFQIQLRVSFYIYNDSKLPLLNSVSGEVTDLWGILLYLTATKSTLICFNSTQKTLGLGLGWQTDSAVFPGLTARHSGDLEG